MPMSQESYRFRVREGDRVRMPNGRTGTVVRYEFTMGGHVLLVYVRPDKPARGWRRHLPVFNRCFAEEQIDRLQPIGDA